MEKLNKKAYYHLPGLFEFYELYCVFLPLYRKHREYFYEWCEISSIYGSPADCIWGGGRAGFGSGNPEEALELMKEYGISARLTFSNSLLREEHLSDRKCNELCKLFEETGQKRNGVIIYSDLLLDYIKKHYKGLYFVSSTTKVLTNFEEFLNEVKKEIRTDLLDIHGERVYVMPAGLPNLKGLRFLRTGLLLGELKKKRFEPSQAFAMTLKKDDYEKIVDLPLEDDRVSRYLKGETLDVDDLVETKAKGWYLVCVDGYPLGWGKLANGTLKNKYLPGWRLNS